MADRSLLSIAPRAVPRALHPGAWWLWALALAVAASHTTNPLLLGLIIGVAGLVVAARREDAPWARAFRIYLFIGLAIVGIRIAFRVLLGGEFGTHVLVSLPEIPLPEWAAGIRIGGDLTAESLLAAFYDGLRLAALIICFGAANSLANPRRLLRILPNAVYEAGTAVTVAMSVAPQLADSVLRVGRARRLRGGRLKGRRSLPGVLLPVLEDALDRSVALAAAMDARGYGRRGTESERRRRVTGALSLVGLMGVGVGLYGLLDPTGPIPLAVPILAVGSTLLVAGLALAGRRVRRSRYRPDSWRGPEWGVTACAVASVILVTAGSVVDPPSLHPSLVPLAWPAIAALPTLGILVAALPVWITPAPATRTAARARAAGEVRAISSPSAPARDVVRS